MKASKQSATLLSDVTVSGKQELMTREDFRVFELEYRNRTETLSEFDRNIYRAQGVYDAGKGMVESGLYSFGVIGTAESRAQWALQTSAAAVQGIARLWNEPRAVFNEWRSDFMGNDPMKIRQASAQATGVGLGVVSGLRATRGLAVKMAEMPGPVAGSRAAQLGAVKIGGDGASKTGTIWDSVNNPGPKHPGSVIPRNFELSLENGKKIWVDGNATKHIAEYSAVKAENFAPDMVGLVSQQQLRSLSSAANTALNNGVQYRQMMRIDGWELIFAPPKSTGQLPALYHALYKVD